MAIQRREEDLVPGMHATSGATENTAERSLLVRHPKGTLTMVSGLMKASRKENTKSRFDLASHASPHSNTHLHSQSFNAPQNSPSSSIASSRSSSPFGSSRRSRPSLASSVTSATISVDVQLEKKESEPSTRNASLRPSLRAFLRSSPSPTIVSRPSVHPSEFQNAPERPEKHLIDSIGMVIPGVCNRPRCQHPKAHFGSHWRLCEPNEYTTALADHGITYTDYTRLTSISMDVLHDTSKGPERRHHDSSWWRLQQRRVSNNDRFPDQGGQSRFSLFLRQSFFREERDGQHAMAKQQAGDLNMILEQVTWHWRRRGLPVVVCVGSFSLFAPNTISEAYVQILHVPLEPQPVKVNEPRWPSFIEPPVIAKPEKCSVAREQRDMKRTIVSPRFASSTGSHLYRNKQLHFRDRTRPWPLWPNAIPSRKREQMNAAADRYGADPYFRAWMRANINSRTKCTSYAKYMIERENDPFINTRLDYVGPPSGDSLLMRLLGIGSKTELSGSVNRKNYEHNRRLECRKTIENGCRLRILRFSYRNPIIPPHTQEMHALGLTREKYDAIISNIEDIRRTTKPTYRSTLITPWNKIRGRNTFDAWRKVTEYIRQTNGNDRRVIWTIEKIPNVYGPGIGCDKEEWEISAWNGQDPLELLIQLERWGIIDKKLNLEDEE